MSSKENPSISIAKTDSGERRIVSFCEDGRSKGEPYTRWLWKKLKGTIPNGYHIHHKDGNTLNDDIENLELLTHKEHMTKHHLGITHLTKTKPMPISKYNKKEIWSAIANELRLAMAKQGIATQKELAKKAGITQQTLSAVFHRRRVSLVTLEKLAGLLKINITKLMVDREAK